MMGDDGPDRDRHRRAGGRRQEHRRSGGGRAGSGSTTSTPVRCIGPSPTPRCAAGCRCTTPKRSPSSPARSPRRRRRRRPRRRDRRDGGDPRAQRHPGGQRRGGQQRGAVRARRTAAGVGATRGGGVVEGRDIASVVFPDARLKLYVTASPRVRAERRVGEIGGDLDEVESAIIERDRLDSTRADSPLREADGAIVVDTSGMSSTRSSTGSWRCSA